MARRSRLGWDWPALQGLARGSLFCFLLLLALAGSQDSVAQPDLHDEMGAMPGTGRRNHVVGWPEPFRGLSKLLEVGFGVGNWLVTFQVVDFWLHESDQEVAGDGKPLIEVQRAHDGFEGLGEQAAANASSGL